MARERTSKVKLPEEVDRITTMFKRFTAAAVDDKEEFERRKGFIAGFFFITRHDKRITKKYFEKRFQVKDIENFDIGFNLNRKDMFDTCKTFYPEFDTASPAH
jgi:hypothetical protein